jgi:hypothetical protein
MNPPAAALSPTIDFFGYHIDRTIVKSHVAGAVTATQAGVAGEPTLLGKVDDLFLGTDGLSGFLNNFAGQFAQTVSLSSPGLGSDLMQSVLPGDTVFRLKDRIGLPGLGDDLGPLDYLFDRQQLLPSLLGNRISLGELRYLRVLPQLANLDWGYDVADAGLRSRLQQLRIYFVEFFHGRFKDRNGDTLTPSGTFNPFQISPELAGQLVHVLIEFTGDAAFGVPVYVPGNASPDISYTCTKAAVITTSIQPTFVPGDPAQTDYSDLIGWVVGYAARQADASTRAAVGGLIRGGGLAGINNEVVAEAIAAVLGGLAKKVAEKIAYETLTRFIADNGINMTVKLGILAVLNYLHRNGPKPPNFPV